MASTPGKTTVTLRHYCQGIGDCHLLAIPRGDGSTFWMLIDCGVHSSVTGGRQKIDAIVDDILSQTDRIDVLVVTHEHTDHVSGFLSAAETFAKLQIGEVWLGWTENPADLQARQLDRYKQDAIAALSATSARLAAAEGQSAYLEDITRGLDALIGFNFGATGSRVRAARDAAVALGKGNVRYLEPSTPPLERADLGMRIYVLGPPRDAKLLGLTEKPSEMYAAAPGGSLGALGRALTGAFAAGEDAGSDDGAPFDAHVGTPLAGLRTDPETPAALRAFLDRHYFGPVTANGGTQDQSWRRIDHDWLALGADLALQLDSRTNNTSLVLAFEFLETGRVLLFAADAQIGSWLSWQDCAWQVGETRVTGPDLLARTVYYKVGHHGSHNATPDRKGLGAMTHPDLSAFVPTNAADARKVGWGQMPFGAILTALERHCGGRVIRADDAWLTNGTPAPFATPSGSIRALSVQPGLWVELEIA